jgi:hypothetical protein
LEALRRADKETHEYQGKSYNAYDATQEQRKIETAIRKQKDRAIAFHAEGDKTAEQAALIKAATLNKHYKAFSSAMGLSTNRNLLTTVNFSRSQAAQMGAMTKKWNDIFALKGTVTSTGIPMNPTAHLARRAIERNVSVSAIRDALTNPMLSHKSANGVEYPSSVFCTSRLTTLARRPKTSSKSSSDRSFLKSISGAILPNNSCCSVVNEYIMHLHISYATSLLSSMYLSHCL